MKKILIIGAGFLQTYVIKRSRELGYYTYAIDGSSVAHGFNFADEYAVIDIVNQEACLSYAREKQIDGVLTAATDYGVLTASYIAEKMGLPGLNYQAACSVKNKYLVRRKLFEAKADDTEQAYEIEDDNDIEKIKGVVHLPVMVKPCDGSGSRGASKVEDIENFQVSCRQALRNSITHRAVVESFVSGKEYGVESFVYNGEITVLAVMRKWMTKPPYYAELGHSIPSCLSNEKEAYIVECVKKAISALGINFGCVNMDILLTADGTVHIVDVGARMGGNLIGSNIIPTGTGIDYMGAMINATVGETVDLAPRRKPQCVVTRLLALKPGKVKELPDFERIENDYTVQIHHHLNIGGEIFEYHTNLDGCGYVVSVADGYEEALKNAEEALSEIDNRIVRW